MKKKRVERKVKSSKFNTKKQIEYIYYFLHYLSIFIILVHFRYHYFHFYFFIFIFFFLTILINENI